MKSNLKIVPVVLSVILTTALLSCRFDLDIPVSGISLNKEALTLIVGGTERLIATIEPVNANNKTTEWSSSDTLVALVEASGRVRANAEGVATITVKTLDGDKTATCRVTVAPISVSSVSLNKTSLVIEVGGTEMLTATVLPSNAKNKEVSWSSSNENLVRVDNGMVTAIAGGVTLVTVKTDDGGKTATCEVIVTEPVDEWYAFQTHTVGSGIDMVFMGDGYTAANFAQGKYAADIGSAIEGLFEVEPYKTYRNWFNVYVVNAISVESGIGTNDVPKNTVFSSFHGEGTHMAANNDACFSYASKAPIGSLAHSVVVLIANSDRWGGTTWWWTSGEAIAICAAHPHLKSLVQHEAGGHGFGKLADEYIDATIAETVNRNDIPENHLLGYSLNVDITDDPAQVIWRDFLGNPKYSMVGLFEGAYYFETGVWRSEEKSCMIDNIPYFNAPSRAAIVRRIMQLAGEPFSMEWFMSVDVIEDYASTRTSGAVSSLPRLASPVFVNE